MIGSTKDAMLRMGILLFAFANSVRICNISNSVEITSAKAVKGVAFFAIKAVTDRQELLHGASRLDSARSVPQGRIKRFCERTYPMASDPAVQLDEAFGSFPALIAAWGGCRLDIPKGTFSKKRRRDDEIRQRHRAGADLFALRDLYGLSDRHLRRILFTTH